jgi:hypothetical protein
MLQPVDCHNNVWSLKDLHQPFKEPLIIVRSGCRTSSMDMLRVAHRLKRQLLVGHQHGHFPGIMGTRQITLLKTIGSYAVVLRLSPPTSAVRIVCVGQENAGTKKGKHTSD